MSRFISLNFNGILLKQIMQIFGIKIKKAERMFGASGMFPSLVLAHEKCIRAQAKRLRKWSETNFSCTHLLNYTLILHFQSGTEEKYASSVKPFSCELFNMRGWLVREQCQYAGCPYRRLQLKWRQGTRRSTSSTRLVNYSKKFNRRIIQKVLYK